MNQSLVITAIGEDRPGIVNELSRTLLDAGLNIEDSRMSVLGGEFAVMLLVSGSSTAINTIEKAAEHLSESLNLKLLIKATSQPEKTETHSACTIRVEGMDNPGIVHKLTEYLSRNHINIINMQTSSSHAPHTGTPLFSVQVRVNIPPAQDINSFQAEFTELCDALNMDTEFTSD
ncbi:Glycine cleavage system transcriptional antiactivator GcvR [hydrothermal vent metagenome]|uniref:Glycine cleavage system transcriptional antiactivator GcvR n=1 Tax=hydrothermal vent metagenome TaxID=652676 RepID=A0A3B0XSX8_9ZZZZ